MMSPHAGSSAPARRVSWMAILPCLMFVVLLVACSSSDSKGIATAVTTDTPAPTASAPPTPVGAYEELLGVIPDTPETRHEVDLNDYDLLRRSKNIAPPTDPADPEQKKAYVG